MRKGGGRSRGYRAERELVIKLWRLGFAVLRAPASGARIKRADYPDIVAIKEGRVAVMEVKSRTKLSTIYVREEQIRKLINFAKRAGGQAYIAIKIPYRQWKIVPLSKLKQTSSGTYKVEKEVIEKALGIEQILLDLGLVRSIKEYITTQQTEPSEHDGNHL